MEHYKEAQVSFDSRIYQLTVVKKAAYRFLKSYVTEISQQEDAWVCLLKFGKPTDGDAVERLKQELQAEVLDQDLRATISRETETMRNAVLAFAFSRTGLQGSE